MKIKILLVALLVSCFSWGQIASDGLNSSTTLFTLSGGAYYTGSSVAGDRPATSPFFSEGTASRGAINTSAQLTSNNINTSLYTGISATFRLAAFSIGSTSNGMDGTDVVTVEISPDGGTTYYSTVRVLGNSNCYWAYSTGTGTASTAYDGNATPVDFTPAGGGNRTTDGYSTVTVTGLPAITNLRVRITMLNNATAEQWVMDDFKVTGTLSTPCSTPSTQASTVIASSITTSGANFAWTDGASTSGSLLSLRLTANAITAPSSGTDYTATTNFSTAAGANLIDANNVVIAKNNTGSVTGITGLAAGTQYTATPYAYNGAGTNVCFNTTNPESLDFYTLALEPTTPTGSFSSCSAVSTTSISLGFTAANTITNGTGYILVYRQGAAPTGLPTDGSIYSPGAIIGDATVFGYIAGAATTVNVTGLNGGSTYYFALIPYGAAAGPIPATVNYRTATTITTNCNTSPAPEINVVGVVGSNPTIVDGDTTPSGLDNTLYGTFVVGSSSPTKTFRIQNTGNANLTITALSMVGGNSGDFTFPAITFPLTIAGGAFYDLVVTFTPSGAGTRNTTLTITNNDANEGTYDFLIQGTGSATSLVEINVKGNGNSIADNSIYPSGTNHTAFPVTVQGFTSTRTFTIENLGTTTLGLTGASPYVTITGAHAAQFSITAIPSNSIAGGSTTTFDVTFTPTSGGAKNATITIYNNDTDEAVYNFNISGTCQGTNNIYVTGNGYDIPTGSSTTSTTNLTNFGLVAVTSGVKQNTFVVTNLSGSTRYLSTTPVISGADASMFSVVGLPTNGALSNSNTTSFTISFTPTSAGVKNATVTFNVYTDSGRTTPDSINGTFTFAIAGEGIVYTACANNAVQTIIVQDFEAVPATPTWGYSSTTDGTTTVTGGTYNNGSGAVNAYIGARSFQFTGIGTSVTRSAVITMAAVDVSNYNNINFSMRVGAFRGSGTTQGMDVNDLVQVETSIDGGVNWSVESVLKGYTNSRWSFGTTGTFNAYYTGVNTGTTQDTRNGNAELTGAAGISYYYVKNLPQSTALLIRITLNVDRSDEVWALDDVKIEGQTAQSTTWNGSAWTSGFPTSSTKAIFDVGTTYTTTAAASHGSVEACELQIKSGATVNVDSGYYMEIQSNITNVGTLNIANAGSLVQVNDTATNSGNIVYNRTANGVDGYDYVYWSSPVGSQTIGSIYSSPTPGYTYKWNPLATNINSPVSSGNWQSFSGAMDVGSGYIVRGSSNYYQASTNIAATFTGTVNNGVIPVTISRGTNTTASQTGPGNGVTVTNYDDNWNLLGNPYPSSINAIDFLTANTSIQGFVYLWTHGNAPAAIGNPFYGSYAYNYANTDYITYNSVGGSTGPSVFNGYIGGAQGFFVIMNDGATGTSSISFKNSMRSKTYSNSQFYRTALPGGAEKHRIWLDLVDSNNSSVRTLLGYVPEATLGLDRMCDAFRGMANDFNIYTLAEDQTLIIQGRPTPFDSNDQVPVGVRIMHDGTYKIAIGAVDGLFADATQNIYLEDRVTGQIFDLRANPYTFTSSAGIFNDRFVLRYNNTALGNPDFGSAENNVIVTSNHGLMTIKSLIENIQDVTVYDILGRTLLESKAIGNKDFSTSNIATGKQTLIVKIKLENGIQVTRKIVL